MTRILRAVVTLLLAMDACISMGNPSALHPTVREKSMALTRGLTTPRERAVAIFEFVRDGIAFGWTSDFYDQRPEDVLAARVGYCNTKSTIFIALLKVAGIEARPVYVDISSEVLHGFDVPGPFVDHSYTEVFLEGRWLAVDAYVVDRPL